MYQKTRQRYRRKREENRADGIKYEAEVDYGY